VRFVSGRALLIHLRMTGNLLRDPAGSSHLRALLRLDDGTEVGYRDVRRFGTWLLLEPGELEPYLGARVGEEPLVAAFTAKGLGERLEGRRAPLKAALLDQRTLAGLGNIYVDEALWYARLHPLRPAGSLDRDELRRLHRAIRKALELGIARQGSTLSTYRLPDGSSGSMQKEFKAYGRVDEPCDRCGTPIAKSRVGGRGTWFCPNCQRL
jgi:formamidopyrimidine-DNA glycosylase